MSEQLSLDLSGDDGSEPGPVTAGDTGRWRAATGAIDAVRARFGDGAVGPAVLVEPGGLRVGRRGDNRWEPVADDDAPDGPERS